MPEKLTWVYAADVIKSAVDEDTGDLMVIGKASGTDLDIDKQRCDPIWLKTAMPNWMRWGNVREQHGKTAAGVGVELESDGDDWFLKAAVIDPITALKVTKGVLKGFSIGIKGERLVKDAAAPGGRIVGGEIVEISLVDRPANPTCFVSVATKSADASTTDAFEAADAPRDLTGITLDDVMALEGDALKGVVGELLKRDFTDAERQALAAKGQALPGGGFPIPDVAALKDAIEAIGRAKDPAATKAYIKKRAKALGQAALVPDTWKAADPELNKDVGAPGGDDDTWVHDPAVLVSVRNSLAQLIQAELDELMRGEDEVWDVQDLLCTLKTFLAWWQHEAWNGEDPNPTIPAMSEEDTDMDLLTLGVSADLVKAATAADATDEAREAVVADFSRVLGLDKLAAAVSPETLKGVVAEAVKGLKDDLEAMKGIAAPGGPVTTRTTAEGAKAAEAAEADHQRAEAARYRQLANTIGDRAAAQGYREKAAECEDAARKLAATATA